MPTIHIVSKGAIYSSRIISTVLTGKLSNTTLPSMPAHQVMGLGSTVCAINGSDVALE
jgi:hypothetical protein